jgi:hypothetical protein
MKNGNPNYRNKLVLNQRGASIDINNSTDREEIKISQYSGSNVTINNLVNSELATNNKQVKVLHDNFTTVGNTNSEYIAKDNDVRVGENSYEVKGFATDSQVSAMKEWVDIYKPHAENNARFEVQRGSIAYPGEISQPSAGSRLPNPDLAQTPLIVNNKFLGYTKVPIVTTLINEVSNYIPVPSKGTTLAAKVTTPSLTDITDAFDRSTGTSAPGIAKYGPSVSSSTQGGSWQADPVKASVSTSILGLQNRLLEIESKMGNGGDSFTTIKRNRVENIGGVMNTYPSIRVDMEGKSVNTDVGVSTRGTYVHKDFVPVVEEVDNSSNFPGGNSSHFIANSYNVTVGSGGITHKTTGPVTVAGTSVKVIGTQSIISGSAGVSILSEKHVDILSDKIHLRSPRQVYIDTSLGVANNLVVAGGAFVEGELYVNHITCPVEVQETQLATVYATPIKDAIIGYCFVDGGRRDVYGSGNENTIKVADHSHHFYNVPLTLKNSNEGVRKNAFNNNINKARTRAVSTQVLHELKVPTD